MYIILGSPSCFYCKAAMALCEFKRQKFLFIDLSKNTNKPLCKKMNKYIPNSYKTVPKIISVYKNKYNFLGGHNELRNKLKMGGKTKKRTKKGKCAPRYSKKNSKTCYDKKALVDLIKSYNHINMLEKIQFDPKENVESLWEKLDDKLSFKCDDEACWSVETNNDVILKDVFRPYKPRTWKNNPREWLSTNDIDNVLNQYERQNPTFRYLGCIPIDFDTKINDVCVDRTHCSFELKDNLNKDYIASVYNLDKHNESGSHWVSSFINNPKREVYFFDSVGRSPPDEISKFVKRIQDQSKSLFGVPYDFKFNKISHQKEDTECGIYCLNFIDSMLRNTDFESYIHNIQNDDLMFKNREIYFS